MLRGSADLTDVFFRSGKEYLNKYRNRKVFPQHVSGYNVYITCGTTNGR